MLVLSRKVGEKIVIGNNITLVVQRIGKGRVALAIDAPHDITVLRGELAPFGVEEASIEFLDEEEDEAVDAPRPLEHATGRLPRKQAGRTQMNNRLRNEASTRSGFPRSTAPTYPTSDTLPAHRSQPFPSR